MQSSGCWDYVVRLWSYKRGGEIDADNVNLLTGHRGNIHSVIFSKQGMLVSEQLQTLLIDYNF